MTRSEERSTPAVEEALSFACEGDSLVGVLHRPAQPSDLGMVMIVGGPQVRCGAHRLYLEVAREVAAAGHAVLRFDLRGMGDSTGEPRGFEDIGSDIDAAIEALTSRTPTVQRVVLFGLCDGASAALLYLRDRHDAPIDALVLLNPWARSTASLARTRLLHYYTRRLLQPSFWRRLLTGSIGLVAMRGLASNVAQARAAPRSSKAGEFRQHMAEVWRTSPVPRLLILSDDDATGQEFATALRTEPGWRQTTPTVERLGISSAGHTMATRPARQALLPAIRSWMTLRSGGRPERNGTVAGSKDAIR